MAEAVWLDLSKLEELGYNKRTLQRHIKNGRFTYRIAKGLGGSRYQVELDSLPINIKSTYYSTLIKETELSFPVTPSHVAEADPEAEANLISTMTEWEQAYVRRFLVLYQMTRSMKGTDLKSYLKTYGEHNPEFAWSYGNYMKLKAKYEAAGKTIAAIRPKWGKRAGDTCVPDEPFKVFCNEYLSERQPSSYGCWKIALGYAKRQDNNLDISEFPSHTAFLRRLRKEIPENAIFYKRYGLAKWKSLYGYSISRNYDDLLCGEVWVSDHVQSDVAVQTADGRVHFLWITVWVDVKSQKWLGWDIHMDAPNSSHIFTAFYRAAKTYGIPQDIIVDNGKDYRCKALTGGRNWHRMNVDEAECLSLFGGLKISTHFAWPYNPESKICERTFSKVNTMYSRFCTGYRGPNIIKRPDALKDEIKSGEVFTESEFRESFNHFILNIYNREQSNGKVLQGRCPDELWSIEYPSAVSQQRVRIVTADALKLFCSPLSDSIQIRKSIVYDRKYDVKYYAPWMINENGNSVRMRRDEDDYSTAWFWEDKTLRFLGTAELDGTVSALANTPVKRSELEQKIKRKRAVERHTRNYIKAVSHDNHETMQNRAAAVEALNEAKGFIATNPKIATNILVTEMDRTIAENHRRKKQGDFDYSQFAEIPKERDTEEELDLWGTKAVNF